MVTEEEAENEYWPSVCAALNSIPILTWIAIRASAAAYAGFIRKVAELSELRKATMAISLSREGGDSGTVRHSRRILRGR
jgi:hypothetical protein